MTALTLADIKAINTAAKLHPAQDADDPGDRDTYPAIEVGGAMVFAYVDPEDGALCVSVDLDTTHDDLIREGDESSVPLQITVQGEPVFDDTDAARARRIAGHSPDPTRFRAWLTTADITDEIATTAEAFKIDAGDFWADLANLFAAAMSERVLHFPQVASAHLLRDGDDEDAHAAVVLTLYNGLRLVTEFYGRDHLCPTDERGIDTAARALAALYAAMSDQLHTYHHATLRTGH